MKPIPITRRRSVLFVDSGKLLVQGGECLCRTSQQDYQISEQKYCALLLGPGTSITHEFVKRCALAKCYLIWTSAEATGIYSAFGTHHSHPQKIIKQVQIHTDHQSRLQSAERLYQLQFKSEISGKYSNVAELRGKEGSEMRHLYQYLAKKYGVLWHGRKTSGDWYKQDPLNRAISLVNAWLYGLVEAVILTLGYSPSIGIIHANKPRSFVYDIADTLKPKYYLPFVFRTFSESSIRVDRKRWKTKFVSYTHRRGLAKKVVNNINTVMGY